MDSRDYLDRLLLRYSGTYDIYKPFWIGGREYPAYGYFFSHMEKYMLVREVNMWSADSYEHILFAEEDVLTDRAVEEAAAVIRDHMEPELVRKGERLPGKNHMYSYLTVVILVRRAVGRSEASRVRRFLFDKGYRFGMRGYSQGRLIAVDLEREKVYAGRWAGKVKKLYREVFEDVKAEKPGFAQMQLP